jgi:hypothetical protein
MLKSQFLIHYKKLHTVLIMLSLGYRDIVAYLLRRTAVYASTQLYAWRVEACSFGIPG